MMYRYPSRNTDSFMNLPCRNGIVRTRRHQRGHRDMVGILHNGHCSRGFIQVGVIDPIYRCFHARRERQGHGRSFNSHVHSLRPDVYRGRRCLQVSVFSEAVVPVVANTSALGNGVDRPWSRTSRSGRGRASPRSIRPLSP